MFKTINCNYDQDLLSVLVRGSDFHSISTRSRNDFGTPLYKRSKSQNGLLLRGIEMWNKLPSEVKNSNSLAIFKQSIDRIFT